MGNQLRRHFKNGHRSRENSLHSTEFRSRENSLHLSTEVQVQIDILFNELTDTEGFVGYWKFQEKFGHLLSASLWKYLHQIDGHIESLNVFRKVTEVEFRQCAESLFTLTNDELLEILLPADNLIRTCCEAARISLHRDDETWLRSLIQKMESNGSDKESVMAWIDKTCPGICRPVREKIRTVFSHRHSQSALPSSEILTPLQMLILGCCLPKNPYFCHPISSMVTEVEFGITWTLLNSSRQNDTLRVEKFQDDLFVYPGATVCIFELNNHEVYAIATDEQWRNAREKFGGFYTVLFKLSPTFERIDGAPPTIHCNLGKIESSVYGLSYDTALQISESLSNVVALEAWGCQGKLEELEQLKLEIAELEQERQKIREQAVEHKKNGKTKKGKIEEEYKGEDETGGSWKQNVDKQLLEMAGKKFSDNRRGGVNDRPADDVKR
ncbi:hypothetical protein Ddc_04217 [Ditylenchus destructor]|nr:hypothetical protein Ddc_04217 [Ditylenchus destructor]